MKQLPPAGTSGLLEKLSPHVPDDLINSLLAPKSGPGRPSLFSAAQLFRVNLLALLTPVHSFNLLVELLAENRSWRTFARLRNRLEIPDVRMLHQFRQRLDLSKLRRVNECLLKPLVEQTGAFLKTVALIGGRSRKDGYSRYYVGYKKHTLRLWLRQHRSHILLVPLISWAAPANRDDAVFLEPSVAYCANHLEWTPDIVVGDLAYLGLAAQRRLREGRRVALVTKFRSDMVLPDEFDDPFTLTCEQGQVLQWLGLHEADQLHWFGVSDPDPLCTRCWQRSTCPQEFSFKPSKHEILYGTIPFSSRVGQQLLRQARSRIEASQSYEKNQLGLSQFFLNSLRLAWTVCLLADTVALLRASALIAEPNSTELLHELMPRQMHLNLPLD
jgi:hypothetical protein